MLGQAIELSPNSRLIASGNPEYGCLEIWNWRDGFRKIFRASEKSINDIRFSPDGRYIAVSLQGPEVLICNVRTGQLVRKLMGDYENLCVAFMPDGKSLLTGSINTVKCWDISFLDSGSQMKAMGTGTANEIFPRELEVRCFCVLSAYGNSITRM